MQTGVELGPEPDKTEDDWPPARACIEGVDGEGSGGYTGGGGGAPPPPPGRGGGRPRPPPRLAPPRPHRPRCLGGGGVSGVVFAGGYTGVLAGGGVGLSSIPPRIWHSVTQAFL